ncbi:MAG: hypothetical protein IJ068_00790 [Bacilli bacterium]|nr:hypothetical protein [Bacilli bacterium]
MRDSQIRDYNDLIRYVGERCLYIDTRTNKRASFRNLDYDGYLGLGKNPKKKELFDTKLQELLKKDFNFQVMVRKFNSKHTSTGLRIENSADFFKIGEKLFGEPYYDEEEPYENTNEFVKDDIEKSEDVNEYEESNDVTDTKIKNSVPFTKKIRKLFSNGVFKTFGGTTVLVINGICITLIAGSIISAAFLGYSFATTISNCVPFFAIQGLTAILPLYRSIKSGKIHNWLKKYNSKIKNNEKNNTLNSSKKVTKQHLPNVNTKKEVETPILPKEGPSVARFSEPKKFKLKSDVDKNDDEVAETENKAKDDGATLKNVPPIPVFADPKMLESNSELETENAATDSTESVVNDMSNEEIKVGKHTKKEFPVSDYKKQLRLKIQKYSTGYGTNLEEFAEKYIKLLDNTDSVDDIKKLNNNFENDLRQILNSEINYQNWRSDMMGNSKRKQAQSIRNDSQAKREILEKELKNIDKLQVQKEYIETIKKDNLDNNYINSLCEIVLGKIEDYEKMKKQLDNMNSNDSNYAMKKAEVEKMYKSVYMYAFSVEDVLKQETEKGSVRK